MSNTSRAPSVPGHVEGTPSGGRSSRAVDRLVNDLRRHAAAAPPGSALPSVREIVARWAVSPVTVSRALAELARQGLVVTRPGAGTFVAERARVRPRPNLDWQLVVLGAGPPASELESVPSEPSPRAIALDGGYLEASLQPGPALAVSARRVLGAPGAWARAPLEGVPALRRWFAARIGGDTEASEVLLVQGGQAALGMTLRAVARPGAPVLMESPTNRGALVAARAAGLRPVPVPADPGGIRVELLEEAFRASGARVLYLQPWFSNPTGAVLAPERHAEVLRLARQHHAFVIEDDPCRDLSYRGAVPTTLFATDPGGHAIYIGSLTPAIAPSLRVAALAARGPALARLRTARLVDDPFLSRPLQEIALEFVTSGAYPRHLERVRAELGERMRLLVQLVRERLPRWRVPLVPEGGFHLWVELPLKLDERAVVRRAAEAGVLVSGGEPWFPAEPSGPSLRLSVAAANAAAIEQGVSILEQLGPF